MPKGNSNFLGGQSFIRGFCSLHLWIPACLQTCKGWRHDLSDRGANFPTGGEAATRSTGKHKGDRLSKGCRTKIFSGVSVENFWVSLTKLETFRIFIEENLKKLSFTEYVLKNVCFNLGKLENFALF